jgi:hypothetical protein
LSAVSVRRFLSLSGTALESLIGEAMPLPEFSSDYFEVDDYHQRAERDRQLVAVDLSEL